MDLREPIEGQHVLIVEISSTADTLHYLNQVLEAQPCHTAQLYPGAQRPA
jgi:hypoxanthine-guanine phosphoribosyltransferase